jgi:hypothetical protein
MQIHRGFRCSTGILRPRGYLPRSWQVSDGDERVYRGGLTASRLMLPVVANAGCSQVDITHLDRR